MKRIILGILFFLTAFSTVEGAIVYQNFEADNGTPAAYGGQSGIAPEYGWAFNGAFAGLSDAPGRVRSGRYSWSMTIPTGEHVRAGSGIPAQVQTFNVNFIPECHDRLNFWVWSDPSQPGDHTVMIKFFDQGVYYTDGIGICTKAKARYREWSQLTILFSELPEDFDWHQVNKIELFDYWDGTYYYDDFEVVSAEAPLKDLECLKKQKIVSCVGEGKSNAASLAPVLVPSEASTGLCSSTLTGDQDAILGFWQIRAERRITALGATGNNEPL